MAFAVQLNVEEMAKEMLMQKFNVNRLEHEDMKRDILEIMRWYHENTNKVTLDEKRLFCLNLAMNCGMLYMTFLTYYELPIMEIDEIQQLNLNFDTGISKDLMKYLKCQLSYWEPTSKYISLVFNEMPLKMSLQYDETIDKVVGFQDIDGVRSSDFASKAFIIAAQGCLEAFYQPLGYAFLSEKDSSDDLISWIKKIVIQFENSGYTVCSVVSQQAPVFQKLVNQLGITSQKPYFEVAGKKVFYIFDAVYLLIAVRDLLVNSNLFYDKDKLISWSDIVDIQKRSKVLTEAHINPAPGHKFNTEKERERNQNLASEVFSPVVYDLIAAKYAPAESGTAIFTRTMFKVFKIITDNFQGVLPSYTGTSQQVKAFKDALSMTRRIKLPDSKTQSEILCFSGLQITLNAVMQLQRYYQIKVFMSMFNTEQMLLHEVEIRSSVGITSLNPIQFKYGFSKAMLGDMVRNSINDSMSSCIGPMIGHGKPSSGFVGQDAGQKEHDRLMASIRSGSFEVLFKGHLLISNNGKEKRRHVPT